MTPKRQGHIPDIIVCHITDGAFPGSISWVTNPQSEVSYHYMISRSGEITQCVDIENTAWANGTSNNGTRDNRHSRLAAVRDRRINANLYTVSIGFEGLHSETQGALTLEQTSAAVSTIELIRDQIIDIWGTEIPVSRDNIVGHACITPLHRPNCPGNLFPFERIINHLQALENYLTSSPDAWAKEGWLWAMEELQTDGTRPRDNITRQEAMVLLHRLHNRVKKL